LIEAKLRRRRLDQNEKKTWGKKKMGRGEQNRRVEEKKGKGQRENWNYQSSTMNFS